MKKPELVFNLVSLPLDAVMLLATAVLTFYLRYNLEELVGPVVYQMELSDLLVIAASVIPVLLLIFALLGLYNLKGTRKFSYEFGRVAIGVSVGLFLVIILFFFNQNLFPSRFIILASWVVGILLVMLGRLLLKILQEYLFYKGLGLHNLVIINGHNQNSKIIHSELKNRYHGYRLVAEIDYAETIMEKLEDLYHNHAVDEIIQTNPTLNDDVNLKIVEFARNKGLEFSFVPNLFDVQRNVVEVRDFKGLPVISLKNTPLDGWGKVVKRLFDIAASITCIAISLPLFIVVWIAVRIDSPGPAIYSYLRGGKSKDFMFYKFRSMYTHLSSGLGGDEAHKAREELWKKNDRGGADSPFLKIKNDPRITRVGKFIRKTKLDELPQFWNVLKGDMSMVGPRAHMIDEVVLYRDKYRRMFSVKPGIFGMSQNAQLVNPELPFEEEIRINTYYIENWSLWLDIKTLSRSFMLLFFGKKPKDDY